MTEKRTEMGRRKATRKSGRGVYFRAVSEKRRRAMRDAYYAEHLEVLFPLSEEELRALVHFPHGRLRAALGAALFRAAAKRPEEYTAAEAEYVRRLAQVCHLFGFHDGELLLRLGEYAHRHGLPEAREYYRVALEERPAPLDVLTLPAHLSRYLPTAKDPLSVLSRLRDAFRERGEASVCRLGFLSYRMLWLSAVSHEDLDEAISVARALAAEGAVKEAEESLAKLLFRKAELCRAEGNSALAAALQEEAERYGTGMEERSFSAPSFLVKTAR